MKSNLLKKLLVVVLLLTLAVGVFAACGDKPDEGNGGNGGDGGTTTCKKHTGGTADCMHKKVCKKCGEPYGDYGSHKYVNGVCTVCNAEEPKLDGEVFFNNLWASARSIGTETVSTDKNLGVTLAGSVEVTLGTTTLPIAFDLNLFIDRVDNGTHTAAKVLLSVSELKIEVLYFLDDAENVYIRAGSVTGWKDAPMAVVPFEILKLVEEGNWNGEWGGIIDGYLETPVLNGLSVIDIIGKLVEGFGPNFDLNSTVNGLLSTFGLDLGELAKDETVKGVLDALHIEIVDGYLDIKGALLAVQNLAGGTGLPVTTLKGTLGTQKNYKGQINILSGAVATLANNVLPGLINGIPELSGLIDTGLELWLGYEDVDGAIDSFWLEVVIPQDAESTTGLHSDLRVKINLSDLVIENTKDSTASFKSEVNTTQTADSATLNAKLVMPKDYIKLADTVVGIVKTATGNQIDLSGLSIGGTVEIIGTVTKLDLTADGGINASLQIKLPDTSVITIRVQGDKDSTPGITTGAVSIYAPENTMGDLIRKTLLLLVNQYGEVIDQVIGGIFGAETPAETIKTGLSTSNGHDVYGVSLEDLGIKGNLCELLSSLFVDVGEEETPNEVPAEGTADATRNPVVYVVKLLNKLATMLKQEDTAGLSLTITKPWDLLNEVLGAEIIAQIDSVNDGWYETREYSYDSVTGEEYVERTRVELTAKDTENLTKNVTLDWCDAEGTIVYYYNWGLNDFLSKDCGFGKVCDGKLSTMLQTINSVKISFTKDGISIVINDGKSGTSTFTLGFALSK